MRRISWALRRISDLGNASHELEKMAATVLDSRIGLPPAAVVTYYLVARPHQMYHHGRRQCEMTMTIAVAAWRLLGEHVAVPRSCSRIQTQRATQRQRAPT